MRRSGEFGKDLVKDGVESELQRLLAEQIETLGAGYTLIRREYYTAIGKTPTPWTPEDVIAEAFESAILHFGSGHPVNPP